MKKSTKIIISIIVLILIAVTIFSIAKFKVFNPFSSCFGILEILYTNKEYTIVQDFPKKVAFSKTGDTSGKNAIEYLDEYMNSRGFHSMPEKQMGAELVYSNGEKEEYIYFLVNKYYSKWEWR